MLALSACGGEAEDGATTLTFSWWGSDARHQATLDIINAFESENPDITIDPQYGDFSGYWDQLATQTAGGDTPDIMQMENGYLREYADRDVLMEITDVDLSTMSEDAIESGSTEEKGLVGVPTGVAPMIMVANADLFEEAGVDLPDDQTWTWDDFENISLEISENLDGIYGAAGPAQPADFQTWLRQADKQLVTAETELGFETDDAEQYFEHITGLIDTGAYPEAAVLSEEQNAGAEDSLVGSGEAAMGMWWANQLNGVAEVSGAEMVPLRMPSIDGAADRNGMWLGPTQLLSVSARTEHPEIAQDFIDFMINSEEAVLANGTDRGFPASETAQEIVIAELDGAQLASAEFIQEIQDEVATPEPIPPVGFTQMRDIIMRHELEVYFGNASPQEAAERMTSEMQSAIGE